jgi:hypothetical protein
MSSRIQTEDPWNPKKELWEDSHLVSVQYRPKDNSLSLEMKDYSGSMLVITFSAVSAFYVNLQPLWTGHQVVDCLGDSADENGETEFDLTERWEGTLLFRVRYRHAAAMREY